jgi:hypothetical protein
LSSATATRGLVNFLGVMVVGGAGENVRRVGASGRRAGGYGSKKRRKSEKEEGNPTCVTDNVVPHPLSLHLALSSTPYALGSACDRRMKIWPNPAICGMLGVTTMKSNSIHQ